MLDGARTAADESKQVSDAARQRLGLIKARARAAATRATRLRERAPDRSPGRGAASASRRLTWVRGRATTARPRA